MEVGFSFGSNEGDRLANLMEAKRQILALPSVRQIALSPVYETKPLDVRDEYRDLNFLNAVLIVDSERSPEVWLSETANIEVSMGRERTEERNAPRPIDIDILYVGDFMMHEPGLILPHPRWTEREFVVRPLVDVCRDLVLPGTGRTVAEVLKDFGEMGDVVLFAKNW